MATLWLEAEFPALRRLRIGQAPPKCILLQDVSIEPFGDEDSRSLLHDPTYLLASNLVLVLDTSNRASSTFMTATAPAQAVARIPAHVPGDPFAATGRLCAERLHESVFNRFVVNDSDTNVTVLESPGNESPPGDVLLKKNEFSSSQGLIAHCRTNIAPRLRIISIPQISSYDELEITKYGVEQVLEMHDVSTSFLDVLYAAGKPPKESEEGFGQATETRYEDGSFSLAYLSRYYGRREKAWKLRQTGVYHAYSAATKSNVIILLHPSEQSDFQQALEGFAMQSGSAAALVARPTRVHAMLFSVYFDNWRMFLKEQGDSFSRGADKLFVADVDDEEYLDISFKKLQSWRELEDRIMPLASMFQAQLDLLDVLESTDRDFAKIAKAVVAGLAAVEAEAKIESTFFSSRKGSVKALMASSTGLQKRIHGVLSLLTDTLEMRNHKALQVTNERLLDLGWENVEDSDTVQIITVVTLMYLPASFVATLFGMNLFGFNPVTAHIRIAKDFWLYVAVMIPLTFATVFYWLLRTRKSRAERHKRHGERSRNAQVAISKNWFQMQHFGGNLRSRVVTTV